MKTSIRRSLLTALLAVAVALPAVTVADGGNSSRGSRSDHGSRSERGGSNHESRGGHQRGGKGHSAPEFDPTAVGAIAALIAGGGIVLARRRKS